MNVNREMGPTSVATIEILMGLLAEARRSIPSNPNGAGRCLDRAALILADPMHTWEAPRPNDLVAGGLAPWQFSRAKSMIEARLGGRLSMRELAAAVRLSTGHFIRAFKCTTGYSPHKYLMKRRIARAKELMATTEDALSDIALVCGLSDQAHLSRVFRRFEGDAPGMWRRKSRAIAHADQA